MYGSSILLDWGKRMLAQDEEENYCNCGGPITWDDYKQIPICDDCGLPLDPTEMDWFEDD